VPAKLLLGFVFVITLDGHWRSGMPSTAKAANVADACAQLAAQTNNFEVAPPRDSKALVMTSARQVGSLPSSPRMGGSTREAGTPLDSGENVETGYVTPDEFDEFGLEPGSRNGQSRQTSWDDPEPEQSYTCAWGPEEEYTGYMVEPCAWQCWMVSNATPFPTYQLDNGHGASEHCQTDELIQSAPQENDKSVDWGSTVTVMMRNLPKKLSQKLLLEEIKSKGFGGTYDFVYVPVDMHTKSNRGYAFINFVEPKYAMAFKSCYEGHQLTKYSSRKVIAILPAALQGFEANHAHFASSRVIHDAPEARPVFLRRPSTTRGAPPPEASERSRNGSTRDGAAKSAALAPKPQLMASPPAGTSSIPTRKGKYALNFCPFCGADVQSDFKFCQYCGTSLQLC